MSSILSYLFAATILICLLSCSTHKVEVIDYTRRLDSLAALDSSDRSISIPNYADLLGYGYNSATSEQLGKVVKYNIPSETNTRNLGQRTEYKLMQITDRRQLYNALNIDIKASLKIGIFKGSASYDLAEAQSVNSYSDFLLLKLRVANEPIHLGEAILTYYAKRDANGDKKIFLEKYGNKFFYGMTTGGEFDCLFEFKTTDSETKKAVIKAVSAAASSPFNSGSMSAVLQKLQRNQSEFRDENSYNPIGYLRGITCKNI